MENILGVSSVATWTNTTSAREAGYPATHAFDGEKILCGRKLDFQITGGIESVNCARCLSAMRHQSFPVTDPAIDAPDGAIVDGYQRVSMTWERL